MRTLALKAFSSLGKKDEAECHSNMTATPLLAST